MSNLPLSLVLTAVEDFVDWLNAEAVKPEGYTFQMDVPGRKVVRIIMTTSGGSRSVHAFVDLTNGDLLKAASWKAPAKDPRGNIVHGLEDVQSRFTWSGGYLYKK